MTIKTLLAATAIGCAAVSAANAAPVTLNFPSEDATLETAFGAEFFFRTGDFVEQTFLDTGLNDVQSISLALNLNTNSLAGGSFVNFDVSVNSLVVGDFTLSQGDGLGQFDFSFDVDDADPLADDYTLRFEATNDVSGGLGSISFDLNNTSATLSDQPVAAVPLPASIPLFLTGLAILGYVGRKNRAA